MLKEKLQKIVDNCDEIISIVGDQNRISIELQNIEISPYSEVLSYETQYFIENYAEIIEKFNSEAIKKNIQEIIRNSKHKSIIELVKYVMEKNLNVGYVYGIACALEFTKINEKSITILDALDNKKYIKHEVVNGFSHDGLIVW